MEYVYPSLFIKKKKMFDFDLQYFQRLWFEGQRKEKVE